MISYSIITPDEITDLIGQIDGTFYSGGTNLVEQINTAILNTVKIYKEFSVSVEVRNLEENSNPPPEIMFLHQEYRGRGFYTEYKIVEEAPVEPETMPTFKGLFVVSWHHPDILTYDIEKKPYWNLSQIDMLGKTAHAKELYLCMTGGIDFRSYTQNTIIHDIRNKLTVSTLQSERVIQYYGPESIFLQATSSGNSQLDASTVVSNLYEEVITHITDLGYTVTVSTLPWTISS